MQKIHGLAEVRSDAADRLTLRRRHDALSRIDTANDSDEYHVVSSRDRRLARPAWKRTLANYLARVEIA